MTEQGYVRVWMPEHPLRGASGLVLEHRVVLYDAIGPGVHPCHWCDRPVMWRVRIGQPPAIDDLVVDHLDGNPANNVRENLAPTCQPCNTAYGYNPARIGDDETYIVRSNGDKLRADARVCAQCEQVFLREPSAKGRRGRFCSRSCADGARVLGVCRRGHLRTPENLTEANQCRECMKLAYNAYHARQRARNLTCSTEGCDRPVRVRGLCSRHLGRTAKGTPPTITPGPPD